MLLFLSMKGFILRVARVRSDSVVGFLSMKGFILRVAHVRSDSVGFFEV